MKIKRVLSMILAVVLVVGVLPASVLATAIEGQAAGNGLVPSHMTVTQDKVSTLAPGVTQHEVALFDKNGDRVEMYVAMADMNVDTVKLFASYKNMDNTVYGMSKLTEQVASFNSKAAAGDPYYQGTVVAGINSSYYNMITGKPTGTFVMNGIDVTTESEGNAYGYFAVMKDGSVKIGKPGDYSADKGNIQEAIGIYRMLIVDGVMQNLDDVTKYPRQTIGITADNQVIIMTADGNQAPDSIGLTLKEQAEVMEAMGCVWAGHLDGGGSATYVCKPEGSDDLVITNSPSDGSERSISNGFLIVSTVATSYEFDHVMYEAENPYVTPGTAIKVETAGVSSTGNAADMPEGLTYVTTNGTFENGVFTAGSTVGDATITAMYNGKKAGTVVINVVNPTSIVFNSANMTVPFGKTVNIGITVKYGAFDVAYKPADFNIVLSAPAIGTLNGLTFTAPEEPTVTESTITATLKADSTVTATSNVKLGKGSEVVHNFEDGTNQTIIYDETPGTKYNYTWPETNQQVVSAATGKVHSGNYALAMQADYSNSLESGYMKTSLYSTEAKVFKNAVRVGVWLYIPDECVGLWVRWTLRSATIADDGTVTYGGGINSNTMDTTAGGTGVVYTFCEPGWHYLSADTSAYAAVGWPANAAMLQFYISDRDGSAYGYVASENSNIPSKFQFYLDDITVDYSDAVDDREAPVISNVTYATENMADAAVLNGQTVTLNKLAFGAAIADYAKDNATGINASSVAVYIDGVKVEHTYTNGMVSVADVELTNGKHTVKICASDNMGNYASVIKEITVKAETSKSTVYLAAQNPAQDRILLSSIYNMVVNATAIEEVQNVVITIDLDNNSTWQLDHMIPAAGFTATYVIDETDNIATITITRTGSNTQTGDATLVTLPVRVWTLKTGYTYENGTKAGAAAMTLKQFRDGKEFWRMSVIANVDMGVLTRVDGSTDTFTGDRVFCDTEMWGNYAAMSATTAGLAYYNAWNGGHVHDAELTKLTDKAATCTEAGYEGRTFCETCQSVVDWGTTIPATGHTYEVSEGVLKCACGEVFTGVYTDGKTYFDGIVAAGWVEDSYYVDGVAVTGIQKIGGYYYDFGENGVCANQIKYTGLFFNTELNAYSFAKVGVVSTGWINHEGNWHFFHGDGKAASGHYEGYFFSYGVTYDFEETGKLVTGVWHDRYINGKLVGTMYFYGPACYKSGWQEIDGEQYYFDGIYRAEGPHMIMESNSRKFKCFVFTDEGVLTDELYTGFVETNDFICYVEDNIAYTGGMFKLGNDLYYAHSDGKLATGMQRVSRGNGYVADYYSYPFEENGKLYNGIYEEEGGLVYYVNGTKMGRGVYYNEAGDYYVYVRSNGFLATGEYEVKVNDLIEPGVRLFDENGKMFTGTRNEGGNVYFYRYGLKQGRGVHYVATEDYYVYVRSTGVCAVGYYEVKESAANGLLNPQFYMFGDDGKLLDLTGVMSVAGKMYYFINGAKQGRGLYYNAEGDYYVYVKSDESVVTGLYYVNATNGLVEKDYYLFGEDGRSVTGIVEENGAYYYYLKGVKQGRGVYYNAEGDYYVYVRSNGQCATGLYQVKANDLIDTGLYLFTEDGRSFSGIREENGKLYYYYHGLKQGRGLYYNAEGNYYAYVSSNGQCATGRHYVNVTNDLLPKNYYEFGADGKLVF